MDSMKQLSTIKSFLHSLCIVSMSLSSWKPTVKRGFYRSPGGSKLRFGNHQGCGFAVLTIVPFHKRQRLSLALKDEMYNITKWTERPFVQG